MSDLASSNQNQQQFQQQQQQDDFSQSDKMSHPGDNYNQQDQQQIYQEAEKEMRRIGERRELPEEKDELIRYLAERLQQAEDAITDIQDVLIDEREKKQQLVQELNVQTNQLNDLLKEEDRSIAEKVAEQLKKTLDIAVEQKVIAENQLKEKKIQEIEREYMIRELEDQIFELKDDKKQLKVDFEQILKENQNQKMREMELLNENENLKQDLKLKSTQITELEEDLEENKAILEKLGDVRSVLNRMEQQKENKQQQRMQNQAQAQQYNAYQKQINNEINQIPNNNDNNKQFLDYSDLKQQQQQVRQPSGGNINRPPYQQQQQQQQFKANEDDFWFQNGQENQQDQYQYQNATKLPNINERSNIYNNNNNISQQPNRVQF